VEVPSTGLQRSHLPFPAAQPASVERGPDTVSVVRIAVVALPAVFVACAGGVFDDTDWVSTPFTPVAAGALTGPLC
jgi:hypothetical protein